MKLQTMQHQEPNVTQLYQIVRDINQDLDLGCTLERILSCAVDAANIDRGCLIFIGDNGRFARQLFWEEGDIVSSDHRIEDLLLYTSMTEAVKVSEQVLQLDDVQQDKAWSQMLSESSNVHSAVALPLIEEETCFAVLVLTADQSHYFDENLMMLLRDIASLSVRAMSNAQVHEIEQRRRALSSLITEIARKMNTTVSIQALLSLILDPLKQVIDYDQCIIFMMSHGYLMAKAASGLPNFEELDGVRVRLYKDDFAAKTTAGHEAIWTPDLRNHNTWFRDVTDTESRSWICVPLLANNELLGIITVGRYLPNAYSNEDTQIVNTLAGQAAIALHNASLVSQLQASESRYTNLFEESSDLLLLMDVDGVILDANRKACRMLRRPKDAIIGSDLALLGLNLREAFNSLEGRLTKGREATIELAIKDAYGQEIPLEITAKRVEIEEEVAIQWAGRDITARYELAKMRQDLTQMIVHDLRGPVGTLLGSVELLPFLIQGDATQESVMEALELLQIAVHTGKTLRDLVDSMLDLAKLEQGTFPLKLDVVHLPDLLQEVEYQVLPKAKPKRIDLHIEKGEDGFSLDLDGSIIRRVLVNLVDNAIKYTQSGGKVDLHLEIGDDVVRFLVVDNGPGVPEEHQQHIFDKFGRVDQHSSIQGVGLGLAFCKMAIEAHRGRVWLDTSVEVGSTFIIEIPRDLAELVDS
ncbi:MAG: ATP-binding protein [Chloroflexota bacterium]